MKCRLTTVALLVSVTCIAPAQEGPRHRVETIDARIIRGDLVAISTEKIEIRADGKTRSIPLRDVAEVRLSQGSRLMDTKGQAVLVTAAGDQLAVGNVRIRDGHVEFDSSLLGPAKLPLSAASVLYLPSGNRIPGNLRLKYEEMKVPESTRDVLLLAQGPDLWVSIGGLVKSMDAERILFDWRDSERKVKRQTVPVIRLAKVARKIPKPAGTLVAADGSTMHFNSLTMSADKFSVEVHELGKKNIDLRAVAAIRFASERIVNLSSLKPVRVKEQGFFGQVFAWRKDRSVSTKPLRLDGKTYPHGLGVHSFCELEFDIAAGYSRFVAVVGIDDAVRPVGDATVTFLGDGKPLGKTIRVLGELPAAADAGGTVAPDKPATPKPLAQVVRVDVTGVKKLTIRVEFGPDKLDIGDHVDIAAARLIK